MVNKTKFSQLTVANATWQFFNARRNDAHITFDTVVMDVLIKALKFEFLAEHDFNKQSIEKIRSGEPILKIDALRSIGGKKPLDIAFLETAEVY